MNDQDQVRFNLLYERHINELTLQGKSNIQIPIWDLGVYDELICYSLNITVRINVDSIHTE